MALKPKVNKKKGEAQVKLADEGLMLLDIIIKQREIEEISKKVREVEEAVEITMGAQRQHAFLLQVADHIDAVIKQTEQINEEIGKLQEITNSSAGNEEWTEAVVGAWIA